MSASVRDYGALTALKPVEVAPCPRGRGWRQEAEIVDKASMWVLPTTGDPDEADITLPLRRDLGDFVLRMGDILHTVAAVKQPQSFAEPRTFCRIRAKTLDDRLAAMIAAARCSVTRSSPAVFIHSQRAPIQTALRREAVPE